MAHLPYSVVFHNIIQSYFRKLFRHFSGSLSLLLRLDIPFEWMVHPIAAQNRASAPPPPSAVSPPWTAPP